MADEERRSAGTSACPDGDQYVCVNPRCSNTTKGSNKGTRTCSTKCRQAVRRLKPKRCLKQAKRLQYDEPETSRELAQRALKLGASLQQNKVVREATELLRDQIEVV